MSQFRHGVWISSLVFAPSTHPLIYSLMSKNGRLWSSGKPAIVSLVSQESNRITTTEDASWVLCEGGAQWRISVARIRYKTTIIFCNCRSTEFPRVTLVWTIPHWLLMNFSGCSGSSWIFLSFEHMTNTGGSGADLLRFGVPTGHSLNFGTKLTPSFFRPIWPDRNPPCGFCSSSTLAWVANEPERRKKPNN